MPNDLNRNEQTDSPEPLFRPKLDGLPLPTEHLGPLGDVAKAIADLTQARVEIAVQSALGVSSLVAQAHASVETLAGVAPTSLSFFTVAPSGARKSACDKLALAPVHRWEEDHYPIYRQRLKAYDFELEVYEGVQRKTINSRVGCEGEEVMEQQLSKEPVAPIAPRKILSDVTYEGLLHHFEEGDPSVGIFSDEGGQFFGGHAMNKETQLKTSAGLSRV